MHLRTRNVNSAFLEMVSYVYENQEIDSLVRKQPYKNPNGSGIRYQINEPVTITYTHPRERVLFNAKRDANPFFHMYESLWMLAGRNDVEPLKYYNSRINGFSDDGKLINGAYGYRWRRARVQPQVPEYGQCGMVTHYDQLQYLISLLRESPDTSRAVLNMWNVDDDLLKVRTSKDVCCNLNVVFQIREEPVMRVTNSWMEEGDHARQLEVMVKKYLDMTVFNRSNDLIWGTLGANVVHFSMLQEYMAANLGIEVGEYHQVSSNCHVYDWNWKPTEWLDWSERYCNDEYATAGPDESPCIVPLVKDPNTFEKELPLIVQQYTGNTNDFINSPADYKEPFFYCVVRPMMIAFKCYKQKAIYSAIQCAKEIKADDWRMACTEWLLRRDNNVQGKRTEDV